VRRRVGKIAESYGDSAGLQCGLIQIKRPGLPPG